MTLPDIHTLVPHADPMVLLDKVIAVNDESLVAELTVRSDHLFFDETMQGVGTWIGIEYMAQAIAAYAGYQATLKGDIVRVGFLLGARRYEAHCAYFPINSVLHIYVHCSLQADNGLGAFECQIRTHNALLASATVTVFQPEEVEPFLQNLP